MAKPLSSPVPFQWSPWPASILVVCVVASFRCISLLRRQLPLNWSAIWPASIDLFAFWLPSNSCHCIGLSCCRLPFQCPALGPFRFSILSCTLQISQISQIVFSALRPASISLACVLACHHFIELRCDEQSLFIARVLAPPQVHQRSAIIPHSANIPPVCCLRPPHNLWMAYLFLLLVGYAGDQSAVERGGLRGAEPRVLNSQPPLRRLRCAYQGV